MTSRRPWPTLSLSLPICGMSTSPPSGGEREDGGRCATTCVRAEALTCPPPKAPFLAGLPLAFDSQLSIKTPAPWGREPLEKTEANTWDYDIRWFPTLTGEGPRPGAARADRRQFPSPAAEPRPAAAPQGSSQTTSTPAPLFIVLGAVLIQLCIIKMY